jgi:hypothetical protein
MSRWATFAALTVVALVLFALGWMIPAHLRSTDAAVLARAGKEAPSLAEHGAVLLDTARVGPARMLLEAGESRGVAGLEQLRQGIRSAVTDASLLAWGEAAPPFASVFRIEPAGATNRRPFTELVLRSGNRERLLEFIAHSPLPAVREMRVSRQMTNTYTFAPSSSSSGQAYDTAVGICGALLAENKLTPGMANSVVTLAREANQTGKSPRFEQLLLDFMSLGQRMDWGTLSAFVEHMEDAETLRVSAALARGAGAELAVLFSAVELSGRPAEVCRFLTAFSQTGMRDLGASLRYGVGGVRTLLERNERLYEGKVNSVLARFLPFGSFASLELKAHWVALGIKWLLYFAAGFLLALAVHFSLPAVAPLEKPLQVRGFHVAREVLFGLGFLVVILLFTEPFLSQDSQRVDFPFRVRLPVQADVVSSLKNANLTSFMQQMSLLTLLLFFVIQALIYTACLFKLAEIRRQNVGPRMKLKLLENEDHLFDAGLYLGFVGTIISLILVSLGVIKPSLMAAYSSTSFGIIFVSVFKIFHLRPTRRKLLLQADAGLDEPPAGTSRAAYATQS